MAVAFNPALLKLLLINPKFPESFWSFSWALEKVASDRRAINSPLGLATLAALCPPDWEVTIVDENVEPIDFSQETDLVGVCGMGVQFPRQKEILALFRARGVRTVAGGSYASLCPEEYETAADTVISGEAENIWRLFCTDFQNGTPKKLYRETGVVDLALSPPPRYDLLNLEHYQRVSLQFSRGCPFQCEFCDIIVMFGRKPRTKSLEQVEVELDSLRLRGVKSVFFVDDNLIGNRPKAKQLLAFLADYQERHDYRFSLGTEASINMAGDPELMTLFQRAGFEWVFIGIETPNAESLKETKKSQNLQSDLLTSIRTIYAHNIDIFAGFIVGFDSDDTSIFERQFRFIVDAGITIAMVGLLHALPKTPLHARLSKAGRLRPIGISDNTAPETNIIPLKMTYGELIEGYRNLHQRLMQPSQIHRRIANKLRYFNNPPSSIHLTLEQKLRYFGRFVLEGILPGGLVRVAHFARSMLLGLFHPRSLPVILSDWVAAISLKVYGERYFAPSIPRAESALRSLKATLAARFSRPWQSEWVRLRLETFRNRPHILIRLQDTLDGKSLREVARALRKTLGERGQGIILDCLSYREAHLQQMRFLLKKLKSRRHQVHLQVSEALYQLIRDEMFFFSFTIQPA